MGGGSNPSPESGIVVTGYTTVDWLSYSVPNKSDTPLHSDPAEEINIISKEGGAALVRSIICKLLEARQDGKTIDSAEVGAGRNEEFAPVQTLINLIEGTKKGACKEPKKFVVGQKRHVCHTSSWPKHNKSCQSEPPAELIPANSRMLIHLEIAKQVPPTLTIRGNPYEYVIYSLAPIQPKLKNGENGLESLRIAHQALMDSGCPEKRFIVITEAKDLRAAGLQISRNLSWERTAEDLILNLKKHKRFSSLLKYEHLVVYFNCDGAIHIFKSTSEGSSEDSPEDKLRYKLHFDPKAGEGTFARLCPGNMIGKKCAFIAGLGAMIAHPPKPSDDDSLITKGITQGIISARFLAQKGFLMVPGKLGVSAEPEEPAEPGEPEKPEKPEIPEVPVYPFFVQDPLPEGSESFAAFAEKQKTIIDVEIFVRDIDRGNWSILEPACGESKTSPNVIVREGWDRGLKGVPFSEFGNFITADRHEIESYRAIRNLVDEYLSTDQSKPLSVGVFGQPGSGKSFGIKEAILGTPKGPALTPLEFNLSQFTGIKDLVSAFQKIRDEILTQKTPLVLFDEFDSFLEGKLGWLKYFLAPMQDGKFSDDGVVHPLGKAVFVFIGGTSSTFTKFSRQEEYASIVTNPQKTICRCLGAPRESLGGVSSTTTEIFRGQEYESITIKPQGTRCSCPDEYEKANNAAQKAEGFEEFRNAKGPDFVSRLRGFVDIKGLNFQDDASSEKVLLVRRAILLRALLLKRSKSLIHQQDGYKEISIDDGVLNAFLHTRNYRHGARSMEQIIAMSTVSNKGRFTYTELPSEEQLEMHVDGKEFTKLCRETDFMQPEYSTQQV